MRKAEDPLWDMGIGFGQVPDRGSHLQLPWEQGTFSFLSDAAGSEDPLQNLLRRPEPCPQPEVVEETRPLKAPKLHAPKLRAVADFRPTDAQAERQAALTKWDQVVRLLPRLFDPTVLSQLHNEDFAVELGNLDLIFSKKSTSTLMSRASSMLRFCSWILRTFPEEVVSEPILFLYCQKLRKEKKDTSGRTSCSRP